MAKISKNAKKLLALTLAGVMTVGTAVPGTKFKISKNNDMSSPVGTYTTGSDGSVTVDDLPPATYYVQETEVPSHLVLDGTIRSVVVEANKTATHTVHNNWIKGKIQLTTIKGKSLNVSSQRQPVIQNPVT